MSDWLAREFLTFEVKETSEGVGHWLDQTWVDETQRLSLLDVSILVVPHAGDDDGPVFPVGTAEFVERFRESLGNSGTLAVAIRSADYQEISLHSKAWRLPTIVLTYGIIPVALNILSNRIDQVLPGLKVGDTTEITLILEGPNHKALKLHFKGDACDLRSVLSLAVPRFLDDLNEAPASPHQVHPRKRVRHSRL